VAEWGYLRQLGWLIVIRWNVIIRLGGGLMLLLPN